MKQAPLLDYDKVLINVRDPVARFVSAFNFMINLPGGAWWRDRQRLQHFVLPNKLAEAITSSNDDERERAIDAMTNTTHIGDKLSWYVQGIDTLKEANDKGILFYIIHTENILNDTERALSLLFEKPIEIDKEQKPVNESMKNKENTYMSDLAIQNIKNWYSEDYECIEYLESINKN